MKTAAIIAEYNPFHNGHLYQLHKAKEITGADYVLSIMSGNFLQRGVPAMWDKYTRAKMAVMSGIDLVIELPFVYATGSAYDFAMGAICTLNMLNIVDYLCFGAETDDLDSMLSIAHILVDEPSSYKESLQAALSDGKSYPAAREFALIKYIQRTDSEHNIRNANTILTLPNNTLALEYICALLRTNSKIKPILIKRVVSDYHDNTLKDVASSAKAIRNTILNTNDLSLCMNQLPNTSLSIIKDTHNVTSPIIANMLSPILQGTRLSANPCKTICDFDSDLYSRFSKLPLQMNYDELVTELTTKNKTVGRVSRALIHYILGYTTDERYKFQSDEFAYYANLLALNKNASTLIKVINQDGIIKIITKKADYKSYMPKDQLTNALSMWQFDIQASELYNSLVYNQYNKRLPNDYQQSPIVI